MSTEGLPEVEPDQKELTGDIDIVGCGIMAGAGCLCVLLIVAGIGLVVRVFCWVAGI